MHRRRLAARDAYSFALSLESHSHQTLDGIRVALEVGDGDAVTPRILATEVDKPDRTPVQVGMSDRQLLVVGGVAPQDVRVHRVIDPADPYRRSQLVGPPMLVPDLRAA